MFQGTPPRVCVCMSAGTLVPTVVLQEIALGRLCLLVRALGRPHEKKWGALLPPRFLFSQQLLIAYPRGWWRPLWFSIFVTWSGSWCRRFRIFAAAGALSDSVSSTPPPPL